MRPGATTDRQAEFDLLVVGGGINGCGIARDAVGRGLTVLLCEQGDLAGATSSASTKLIHGGLRYLEYHEFRLVREALAEREVLLRAAPHIIWPLRFVLPQGDKARPAWLVRLGLLLYDNLGGRKLLPRSRSLDLRRHPAGRALKPGIRRGFEYSDCWVEDSRLVVLNARDAADRGATILTRTRCEGARRDGGVWRARLAPAGGVRREATARALVNAAGPWVVRFLEDGLGLRSPSRVRQVKGSHIVVPRFFEGEAAYILQNDDRRIVFAIPYERDFVLIGTTDLDHAGDPAEVGITEDETAYLCRAVSRYTVKEIAPSDVVWSYSGVRPLYDNDAGDPASVTRDYVLELDADGPPVLTVLGGKITTYRRLAEHALEKLAPALGIDRPRWTSAAPLPGGDIPAADFAGWLRGFQGRNPWLDADLARRYGRAYGTRADRIVGEARSPAQLGRHFGEGLYEAEMRYLVDQEWAKTAEDVLWRRSKLGLHVAPETAAALAAWMPGTRGPAARAAVQ